MNHAGKGRLVPRLLCLFPIGINGPNYNVAAPVVAITARFVRKADHLARVGIEFGMGSEGGRLNLPFEIIPAKSLHGNRVQGERRAVFFASEEHAPPERNIGIARGSNYALDTLIVRPGIAVPSEDAPPRGRLGFVAVRLDIALLEVGMAILDTDGRHGAVAVEVDVVFKQRREAMVWLDAVEGPVDVFWYRACDFEIENVALEAGGLVHAAENFCVGECGGLPWAGELALGIALGLDCRRDVEDVSHGTDS